MSEHIEETPQQLEARAYAQSLRKMADWIESNPTCPRPESVFTIYSTSTKEEFAAVAKCMRVFKKEYSDTFVSLIKEFGVISLRCVENREKVCERRVVGKKTVTEKKAIAFEDVQVEREIVEWHCVDSALLKGES